MNINKMFKRKDAHRHVNEIPARFVRKDGILKDLQFSPMPVLSNQKPTFSNKLFFQPNKNNNTQFKTLLHYPKDNKVPSHEISDSYITRHAQHNIIQQKNRRRFSASFFLLKKKKHTSSNPSISASCEIEEEDVTEIACYEDLVAERASIDRVVLGQLDDSQLSTMDLEACEREYKLRMEFIMNNYRHPPPYPGRKRERLSSESKASRQDVCTRQLTKFRDFKDDNASMNNYWQANTSYGPQNPKITSRKISSSTDRLVKRTNEEVVKGNATNDEMCTAVELFEKRKQYYMESMNNIDKHQVINSYNNNLRDTISEIYPVRDYGGNLMKTKGMCMSASVPNLSVQHEIVKTKKPTTRSQAKAQMEPEELEALIAHYRKTSLDTLAPYETSNPSSDSVSIYAPNSPSYVPPSPYLNAEIPEWLQVYAKASQDLDKYLKWEMFRYPELDCWQTMLKRLYKKELEQVVLWFEEYRLALQQQLEGRSESCNFAIKKTEV